MERYRSLAAKQIINSNYFLNTVLPWPPNPPRFRYRI